MIQGHQRALVAFYGIFALAFLATGIPLVSACVNVAHRVMCALMFLCFVAALTIEELYRPACRASLFFHQAECFMMHLVRFAMPLPFAMSVACASMYQWFSVRILLDGHYRAGHVALTIAASCAGRFLQKADFEVVHGLVFESVERRLQEHTATRAGNSTADEGHGSDDFEAKMLTMGSCVVTGLVAIGYAGKNGLNWWRRRRIRVHNFHDNGQNMPVVPAIQADVIREDPQATVYGNREGTPQRADRTPRHDSKGADVEIPGVLGLAPGLAKKSLSELKHLAAAMRNNSKELSTILSEDIERRRLVECIDAQIQEGRLKLCHVSIYGLREIVASLDAEADFSFGYNESIDPQRYLLCCILRRRYQRDSGESVGPCAPTQAQSKNSRKLIQADVQNADLLMGTVRLLPVPPIQDEIYDEEEELQDDAGWESVRTDDSSLFTNVFKNAYKLWRPP